MERVERLLGDPKKGVKLQAALAKYLPVIAVPMAIGAAQNAVPQQNAAPIAPAQA
jgi:hypothetical protein